MANRKPPSMGRFCFATLPLCIFCALMHSRTMKIYTKTGDKGETSLLGGKRVKKNCIEIDAIGEVDELNAFIGILIASLPIGFENVSNNLSQIQHRLFVVGSNIASIQMQLDTIPKLHDSDVEFLENWIDEMEKDLKPLTQFILPSGQVAAVNSFFARAICRRAERRVVELNSEYQNLEPLVQKYLNRLSDTLFVLGRFLNAKQGVSDVFWVK